ncbi:MAG: HpcH/HpaI aldolase family protein [Acidimicrobiales bacterium]
MNPLKALWAAGEPALGGWAALGSPLAAEMLARAGFDYVCIDNQHGVNDYLGTVGLLQAIDCGDSTPLVRVPWNEPGIIGKMLDAGADGVIIPMVNSVAEAEAAVAACRYAPAGARSYGPVRASLRDPDYYVTANDHVACIPMIETVAALAALDDILAVPGIDAVYVGPADLSVSLGLPPGNNDDAPAFVDALETIVAACERHGVVPGIHATTALTERRLEMGFRMVTVTADNVAMRDGLQAATAVGRNGRTAGRSGDGGSMY